MQRVTAPGATGGNLFTNGNPGLGVPATEIEQTWLNSVQEEVCNAITADGTALNVSVSTQLQAILATILAGLTPGGRLTLSTGVPVTTSDVSGATTVFYTPDKSNKIPVYNGARWVMVTFAELSQLTTDATKSPAAVVNNSNYDIFVWNDAGTIRATRGPPWASDTSRGTGAGTTELIQQDGRRVNKNAITNGPAANCGLYVGTVRSDGSAQINNTGGKQHVWNTYNRTARVLLPPRESTATWDYAAGVIRQANANTANQLDIVRGLDEDCVTAYVQSLVKTSANSVKAIGGVGLDSTTALATGFRSTNQFLASSSGFGGSPYFGGVGGTWAGYPGIGRHYLPWLENASASTTFYGDNGSSADTQSGIWGITLA